MLKRTDRRRAARRDEAQVVLPGGWPPPRSWGLISLISGPGGICQLHVPAEESREAHESAKSSAETVMSVRAGWLSRRGQPQSEAPVETWKPSSRTRMLNIAKALRSLDDEPRPVGGELATVSRFGDPRMIRTFEMRHALRPAPDLDGRVPRGRKRNLDEVDPEGAGRFVPSRVHPGSFTSAHPPALKQ